MLILTTRTSLLTVLRVHLCVCVISFCLVFSCVVFSLVADVVVLLLVFLLMTACVCACACVFFVPLLSLSLFKSLSM